MALGASAQCRAAGRWVSQIESCGAVVENDEVAKKSKNTKMLDLDCWEMKPDAPPPREVVNR